MNKNRAGESGSIIVWIFIAVALFAALSFAVSNIGRSGNPGEMGELARLKASDIMQYAGAAQRSLRSMRINGVDESEICFHAAQWGHNDYEFNPPCADQKNRLFSAEGGNVSFQTGVEDWYDDAVTLASDGRAWVFSARYEVSQTGTDSGGAGTVDDNADIVIATGPLRLAVCEAINALLNYDATPPLAAAGLYNGLATSEFDGTFNTAGGRIGAFGRERCVNENNAHYFYYKVILAR